MHMLGKRKKVSRQKTWGKYATRVDELEPMTACTIHHATNKISSYFTRILKKNIAFKTCKAYISYYERGKKTSS